MNTEKPLTVTKRDGSVVAHDLTRVQLVLQWACSGGNGDDLEPVKGVSPSSVEVQAKLHYYDGMPTSKIHGELIKAAESLIDEDHPNYDRVAARLLMFGLKKEVYGSISASHVYDLLKRGAKAGYYDRALLEAYSKEEWNIINGFVNHKRDDLFRYAGLQQVRNKYLLKDKNKRAVETPQVAYVLIAAALFSEYPEEVRLWYVRQYYDAISQFQVSLPTPIMCGVRTPARQFSSCVLIDTGDSLDSITESARIALKYGANRAGMGINVGRLRAENQPVKGGLFKSAGPVPFLKFLRAAVKACTQSGVRASSATFNFPFWHLDFEQLVVLKNDEGTEDNRIRDIDYCVHLNRLVFDRLRDKADVTLFSPEQVPEVYDAFYGKDYDLFLKAYEQAEQDPHIKKARVPAAKLLGLILTERVKTGRIYVMFADNVNSQSPFYEPIKMTNLCFGGENRIYTDHGYLTMEEAYLRGGSSSWDERENRGWVVNRGGLARSTQVCLVDEDALLFRVRYDSGREITVTSDHQHIMLDGTRKATKALLPGDAVPLLGHSHVFGQFHDPEYAELAGAVIGDGSVMQKKDKYLIAILRTWNNPELIGHWVKLLNALRVRNSLKEVSPANKQFMPEFEYDRYSKTCRFLGQRLAEDGLWVKDKHKVPASIWEGDKATVAAFLRGLFDTDGHFQANPKGGASIVFSQSRRELILEVQVLLGWLGINSRILNDKPRTTPESTKGGRKIWGRANGIRLFISKRDNLVAYFEKVGFADAAKQNKLEQYLRVHPGSRNSEEKWVDHVVSVTYDRNDKTYCLTEPKDNEVVVNNVVIGQCVEITQHTQDGDDGKERLTALCTLSAINWGEVKTEKEMEAACDLAVRALDELLDYQDYQDESARRHTTGYRPLGIGIINFAYWLHSRHKRWGEGLELVAEKMEQQYYYLLKASAALAAEKGGIPIRTVYHDGEFVWQKSKLYRGLNPDTGAGTFELPDGTAYENKMDWAGLSATLKATGIRNSTVTALMPSEASSIVSNSTNGIEPPRQLVTTKGSADGKYPIVVPGLDRLAHVYQRSWSVGTRDYLRAVATLQIYVDQAISANTTYDVAAYPDRQIPMKELMRDLYEAHKNGVKTLYYSNINKHYDEDKHDAADDCAGGACKI